MQLRKDVIKEYEKRKDEIEILKLENLRNKYLDHPFLEKIDQNITHISHQIARLYLLEKDEEALVKKVEELRKSLKKAKEDRELYIKNYEINEDKYNIKYNCNLCKDTGYYEKEGKRVICDCLRTKLLNQNILDSEFNIMDNNGLNDFNLNYYSKEIDKDKFGIDISPYNNSLKILNYFKNYVDDLSNKNVILRGQPGLGKTFILKLVAKELIERGKSVYFISSHNLLEKIIMLKMGNDFSYNDYNDYIYKVKNADYLIIDDLGTEKMSETKFSELLSIVNYRIDNYKPILITTNLSQQIQIVYDDRLASRLAGEFVKITLVGTDIRIKKNNV